MKIDAGWTYIRAGRFDDAVDIARQVRDHPDGTRLRGIGHLRNGEMTAAISAFEEEIREKGRGQTQLGNLAHAYFSAGQDSKAQEFLDELDGLADRRFVSSLTLAAIYFAKSDEDRGYELLDIAVEDRERGVIFLNNGGPFAGQRGDPRFVAIIQRIGLPIAGE